jgi:FkbM family methyltransferase
VVIRSLPRVTAATKAVRNLVRPHYLFQPTQIVRRIAFEFGRADSERQTRLPWGSVITYCPHETIGLAVARRGIYDFPVCEVLLRLSDAGEAALDIGANIGHMTSLLAHAVGKAGTVTAFEPHPTVFTRLSRNVAQWSSDASMAHIALRPIALSDRNGTAVLSTDHFATNQGSGSLEHGPVTANEDVHEVVARRLDYLIEDDALIGVMKIDVEGHELKVLQGAEGLLSSGRIRDVLFEEHRTPPTPVTELLEHHGYTILRFDEQLFGLAVGRVDTATQLGKPRQDEPSLLATQSPERALARLAPRGSAVYRVGPAGRRPVPRPAPFAR